MIPHVFLTEKTKDVAQRCFDFSKCVGRILSFHMKVLLRMYYLIKIEEFTYQLHLLVRFFPILSTLFSKKYSVIELNKLFIEEGH